MTYQHTLQNDVTAKGIGLHSGNIIHMRLCPAPPNAGIVFVRTDLDGVAIKADIANVDFHMLQMATTLRHGDTVVQTTEHLLSALYGMGVDNVTVELDGPEVPIMDGSATPFLMMLDEVGLRQQAVARKILKITKPFRFEKDGKVLEIEPADQTKVTYGIDFDHPLIQRQTKTLKLTPAAYASMVAPARTFGFLKDVNYLKSRGLIKGGSIENAIVLDGDHMLNESLRFDDEFVVHKILDLLGDMAISGYRIQGHFKAEKAGHEVHALFLRALLAAPEHFDVVQTAATADDTMQPLSKPLAGVA